MSETQEKSQTRKFRQRIKKGFLNALILMVLEKEPCHGYLIIKEIRERTDGVWKPSNSRVYPSLKELVDDKLIEFKETEEEGGRLRKVYEITEKGKNALRNMVTNIQEIYRAMKQINVLIFGIDDYLLAEGSIFDWSNGKTAEERISNLEYYNKVIDERILYFKQVKKDIHSEISKLKVS